MPHYFFAIEDHVKVEDLEGEVLPDDQAAHEMATATADDLAKDGHRFHGCRIVARNDRKEVVATVGIKAESSPGSLTERMLKLKHPDKN